MTTWLVGQTNRFRAAVAQNAVTDLTMMWCLSDIQSWTEWEFGGKPWEAPEKYRKHSPLTYADKVKTPTLILHSRDDRRCPLPMGQAYYQALKSRGVPTGLVIYHDEGHGIKDPRHRENVLRRVLDWFADHDKK
jgi:dipeptidyl aminopeptidase/acylaminoacyl peptidase